MHTYIYMYVYIIIIIKGGIALMQKVSQVLTHYMMSFCCVKEQVVRT